jgi:hypothetical protein
MSASCAIEKTETNNRNRRKSISREEYQGRKNKPKFW